MENGSRNGPAKLRCEHPFYHLFRDPLFYVDFLLNLQWFAVICGSRWLPLHPFGLKFGSLWIPFGSLLAPFGWLLVPLDLLLHTLGFDFLTFGPSWCHFSFSWIFSMRFSLFWIFSMKSYAKSYSLKMFIVNQILLIKHIAYQRFSQSFLSKYNFGIDSAGDCRLLQDTTAAYYCRILQNTEG